MAGWVSVEVEAVDAMVVGLLVLLLTTKLVLAVLLLLLLDVALGILRKERKEAVAKGLWWEHWHWSVQLI